MNIPQVNVIHGENGLFCVAVVTSGHYDHYKGCYWVLVGPDNQVISWGESAGYGGDGLGSALTAMKNAKAASKRWFKRQARKADLEGI